MYSKAHDDKLCAAGEALSAVTRARLTWLCPSCAPQPLLMRGRRGLRVSDPGKCARPKGFEPLTF